MPAIVPLAVDWRQETRNKSITEVTEPEIIEDQHENRKITAAEALKKLDEVKYVMEVKGCDHLNMVFNELLKM